MALAELGTPSTTIATSQPTQLQQPTLPRFQQAHSGPGRPNTTTQRTSSSLSPQTLLYRRRRPPASPDLPILSSPIMTVYSFYIFDRHSSYSLTLTPYQPSH